jgi:hypothetical protein
MEIRINVLQLLLVQALRRTLILMPALHMMNMETYTNLTSLKIDLLVIGMEVILKAPVLHLTMVPCAVAADHLVIFHHKDPVLLRVMALLQDMA